MNATILHDVYDDSTPCHPFGRVPSSHIRSIALELADLRLVLSKIRTELALRQGRSTPLRNAKGYVAFDEIERVLILELQAYADYYRGLKALKLHEKVSFVPAAHTEEAARLLGQVVLAYCHYRSTYSHEKRVIEARKWSMAKNALRAYYEGIEAML